MARTMFGKIWELHRVSRRPDGATLLYIDRHLVHDASSQAFDMLSRQGLSLRRPELTLGMADHYVSTGARGSKGGALQREMVATLSANAQRWGFRTFGQDHERVGIVHVVGPELGFTLPGTTLVCGDSHTATHGALGALAFGIGSSEAVHVMATQCLWQQRPKSMRVRLDGQLGKGVSAKDMILALIARIGTGAGTGHVIEYDGTAVRALSMESRMTVCNMTIEAGARAGMIAPDDTTFEWLHGRPFAPAGRLWDNAVEHWKNLRSAPDAVFDKEVGMDAASVAPTVTWGTSPEDALPIDSAIPDPASITGPERRKAVVEKLD